MHTLHTVVVQSGAGETGSKLSHSSAVDVLTDSLSNAGSIGILTLLLLGAASIVAWAIIIYKIIYLRRAQEQSVKFLDTFWGSKHLDAIFKSTEGLKASPVAQVFRAGYIELAKLKKRRQEQNGDDNYDTQLSEKENVRRSLRRASLTELTMMESLLPFLSTVGSTAPFLGLFGTVWGIMSSFHAIGRLGNANLATIAPGVSEALVTTAAGLVAAIPAVVAYNFLINRIKVLDAEMDNFSNDFLNIIERHFF